MKILTFKQWWLAVFLTVFCSGYLNAQTERDGKSEPVNLKKETSALDRAGGASTASNIGLFYENRGKLYPRRNSLGPSGEFPINSGNNYVYRLNPIIAMPDHVISGQSPSIEEWEAASGYNNRSLAQIATSTDESTWPQSGWFEVNSEGEPVFISDQDMVCVYNDSTNALGSRGIEIRQTSYAFGLRDLRNLIIFKFEVSNKSLITRDSVWFGLHADIDVGNVSGGIPEYGDDQIEFDKNRQTLFFFDDGISTEWTGGKTGFFGVSFLQTPEVNNSELGITDFHYILYADDESIQDRDTVLWRIFSSDRRLYDDPVYGPQFFHPGTGNQDIRIDDPSTIGPAGNDVIAKIGSGPYTLTAGETLTFTIAVVAGNTRNEILAAADAAKGLVTSNYIIPRPPSTPTLTAIPGDGKITLFWTGESVSSVDPYTGKKDFQGYRLYKSIDKGLNWDQVDRNIDREAGPDPIPLADFDVVDSIGSNTGLKFSYTDTKVVNGIEYWYALTAYDYDPTLDPQSSLESPIGTKPTQKQVVSVLPEKPPVNFAGISVREVKNVFARSNDSLVVETDWYAAMENLQDTVKFSLAWQKKAAFTGEPVIQLESDSFITAERFAVVFSSTTANPNANRVKAYNLDTKENITPRITYTPATVFRFNGLAVSITDGSIPPQNGDTIFFNLTLAITGNGKQKLPDQEFFYHTEYFTTEGLKLKFVKTGFVKDLLRVNGSGEWSLSFTPDYGDTSFLPFETCMITVTGYQYISDQARYRMHVRIQSSDGSLNVTDSAFSGGLFRKLKGMEITTIYDDTDLDEAPETGSSWTFLLVRPKPIYLKDVFVVRTGTISYNSDSGSDILEKVRVVPNPYVVGSSYEQAISRDLSLDIERRIRFINLPAFSTIHIFTLDGHRIKTLYNESSGETSWDLLNDSNREIAPGIYFFQVKSNKGEYIGRFGVIK